MDVLSLATAVAMAAVSVFFLTASVAVLRWSRVWIEHTQIRTLEVVERITSTREFDKQMATAEKRPWSRAFVSPLKDEKVH